MMILIFSLILPGCEAVERTTNDKMLRSGANLGLGIMEAREHADAITRFLTSKETVIRKDALIALGLLQARQFAKQAAGALNDDEGSVIDAAAVSLLPMNAEAYAEEILSIIDDDRHKGKIPLSRKDVPFSTEYKKAMARAEKALSRIRNKQ